VRTGGLRTPARWSGNDAVGEISGPFRVQVTWGGVRPEDPALYAIYVG
jgi:hypothetical protein